MSQNWKNVEDRIAKQLGGRRVLGNRGSGVPDGDENVPFALEVKAGYEKPRLPGAWLQQAKKNSQACGRPWLIVQCPKHSRDPVATLSFSVLVGLCRQAGVIE